jgi:hypothetical protein
MPTAVDYFGLMAYIWVMSGGMPDSDILSPAQPRAKPKQRRTRTGRRLRVIKGGQAREVAPVVRQTFDEEGAAA